MHPPYPKELDKVGLHSTRPVEVAVAVAEEVGLRVREVKGDTEPSGVKAVIKEAKGVGVPPREEEGLALLEAV